MTEAELAAEVVKWLEGQKYEVYQEVQVGSYGRRADIVAVMAGRIWVIETKTTLSMAVIEQAVQWVGKTHWVSVCVPATKRGHTARQFAQRVLKRFGVGIISYNDRQGWRSIQETRGDLCRKILPHLPDLLKAHGEEFKGQLPVGSEGGGYWTPFKHTCNDLTRYVAEHQGCTMKEAIEGITHHYASDKSARGSLAHFIHDGVVEGLVLKHEEGKAKLYWDKSLVKTRALKSRRA